MKASVSSAKAANLLLLVLLLLAFPAVASADDDDAPQKFPFILSVAASPYIGGAGALPQGVFSAALNSSYRDKFESSAGNNQITNKNVDNDATVTMLKLRYGITDQLEFQNNIQYATYDPVRGRSLDSWGNITSGFMYGILQQKLGDPCSFGVSLKAILPTGSMGPSATPGNGAWGSQAGLGFTKSIGRHLFSNDVWYTWTFEEGNQDVRKGNNYGFTYKYAYALTQHFAAGIEGVFEINDKGHRAGIELQNDYREWYSGPAVTYNIPGTQIALCLGAGLPIYRDYGQNTSSDSVRFDGKIFMAW